MFAIIYTLDLMNRTLTSFLGLHQLALTTVTTQLVLSLFYSSSRLGTWKLECVERQLGLAVLCFRFLQCFSCRELVLDYFAGLEEEVMFSTFNNHPRSEVSCSIQVSIQQRLLFIFRLCMKGCLTINWFYFNSLSLLYQRIVKLM